MCGNVSGENYAFIGNIRVYASLEPLAPFISFFTAPVRKREQQNGETLTKPIIDTVTYRRSHLAIESRVRHKSKQAVVK